MKKGLKVSHDIKELNEGQDVVFTLKDQYILNDFNNDLNTEVDALENPYLIQKKKNEENNKIRSKKNQETLDFNEKKGILMKYDKEEEKEFYINNKESGDNSASDELNNIKEKLSLLSEKIKKEPKLINLNVEKKFASDYLSSNEVKSFKKPKIQKNKSKIPSILEEIRSENDIPNQSNNDKNNKFVEEFDEYSELEKVLEKQRLYSQKTTLKTPEEILENYIKETSNDKDSNQILKLETNQFTSNLSNNKKENPEDIVHLSDTTEFLKSVPSKLEVEENLRLITQTPLLHGNNNLMSGVQSVAYTPLPSEMLKSGVTSVIPRSDFLLRKRSTPNEEETYEAVSQQNETIDPENVSSLAEIMDEDDQSKGIMGTLNILRKRGLLGQTEYSGRFKDRNPDKEMEKFPKSASDRIKLEYRDNKGKLMTSKEAFRYGCWIFHNKKPGKKKMEKKLMREQIEEKLRNKDASLDSKFMNFLKAEQEKSKLPYVVIQKK